VTTLHFAEAMLPEGWARDVRVTVADGVIASVEKGVAARGGDERHAAALPGMPNLHSHAFQRGMAGLAEAAGPGDDSFWTWREVMYLFAARVSPDDLAAIAAMAYAEMLETGFTRVGEFHYLHHAPDGAPYADRAAMSAAIVAAAGETGIALTHLPVFYAHGGFGGAPLGERRAGVRQDPDGFPRLRGGARGARATPPPGGGGLPPPPPARWRPARRSISISPSRCARWRIASRGAARGRWSGCSIMRRWTRAGASSMRRT